MPFVFGPDESLFRSTKRRRLDIHLNMARQWWKGNEELGTFDGDIGHENADMAEREARKHNPKSEIRTSDREELILCIKRGQRPTWIPKPGFEALCAEADAEQQPMLSITPESDFVTPEGDQQPQEEKLEQEAALADEIVERETMPIARNRSALHSGDFRQLTDTTVGHCNNQTSSERFGNTFGNFHSSISPPWYSSSPDPFSGRPSLQSPPQQSSPRPHNHSYRSRAPSLGSSLSSSFVMRIPTSPLVHATNNPALDFSPRNTSASPTEAGRKAERRRTMPSNAFHDLAASSFETGLPNFSRPFPQPQLRRESSLPHQMHSPRRSLSSFTYQPAVTPRPAMTNSLRRLSVASDISPKQHSSMVGSFEESILRGRMSTAPSKPLDFIAQIGVLGKGDCPPSLKCPAHVTIPFPAVFYNYGSAPGSRSTTDDNPSPYVGNIDLEHNLKPVDAFAKKKKRPADTKDPETLIAEMTAPENTPIGRALAREAQQNAKRPIPKAPPGGAYRVPRQGQLQIIIKNPNKTAVKLFLIPYDLEDMQPGTKTFVRQRSFSSGSILENPVSDKFDGSTFRDPLMNKHILRYLIHLKFCCPYKGRYYLYDTIRVVFANRVPDGKERLKVEVQLPEPRYSPYKPTESQSTSRPSPSGARSELGYDTIEQLHLVDIGSSPSPRPLESAPFQSLPTVYHLSTIKDSESASEVSPHSNIVSPLDSRMDDAMTSLSRARSPVSGFMHPSTSTRNSPVPWNVSSDSMPGRSFSPLLPEMKDGLLSRKLRALNENASSNIAPERNID